MPRQREFRRTEIQTSEEGKYKQDVDDGRLWGSSIGRITALQSSLLSSPLLSQIQTSPAARTPPCTHQGSAGLKNGLSRVPYTGYTTYLVPYICSRLESLEAPAFSRIEIGTDTDTDRPYSNNKKNRYEVCILFRVFVFTTHLQTTRTRPCRYGCDRKYINSAAQCHHSLGT